MMWLKKDRLSPPDSRSALRWFLTMALMATLAACMNVPETQATQPTPEINSSSQNSGVSPEVLAIVQKESPKVTGLQCSVDMSGDDHAGITQSLCYAVASEETGESVFGAVVPYTSPGDEALHAPSQEHVEFVRNVAKDFLVWMGLPESIIDTNHLLYFVSDTAIQKVCRATLQDIPLGCVSPNAPFVYLHTTAFLDLQDSRVRAQLAYTVRHELMHSLARLGPELSQLLPSSTDPHVYYAYSRGLNLTRYTINPDGQGKLENILVEYLPTAETIDMFSLAYEVAQKRNPSAEDGYGLYRGDGNFANLVWALSGSNDAAKILRQRMFATMTLDAHQFLQVIGQYSMPQAQTPLPPEAYERFGATLMEGSWTEIIQKRIGEPLPAFIYDVRKLKGKSLDDPGVLDELKTFMLTGKWSH